MDRTGQLLLLDALFFGSNDVAGQYREYRTVHGHRDGDLVERNAVEQDLHVFNGINGYASLADVTNNACVVGVIAAVRCQVEGDRNALTTGSQCLAVKRIGGFRGRETGVLADGPWTHGIHGGLRATDVGGQTGQGIRVGQVGDVRFRIERLDDDAFGSDPVQFGNIAAWGGFGCCFLPGVQIGRIGKFIIGHDFTFQEMKTFRFQLEMQSAVSDKSAVIPKRRINTALQTIKTRL